MTRTAFDRDYFDLHGERPEPIVEAEFTEVVPPVKLHIRGPPPQGPGGWRWAYRMPLGLRLWLGAMAVFWGGFLAICAALIVIVFVVFLWAAVTSRPLPYS